MSKLTGIAKIIVQQIMGIDPTALMSYGSRNFIVIGEDIEGYEGGIEFTVNGVHFKGQVRILLNYVDEYEIFFGNYKDKKLVVEKHFEHVLWEDLTERLDYYIEFRDGPRMYTTSDIISPLFDD